MKKVTMYNKVCIT